MKIERNTWNMNNKLGNTSDNRGDYKNQELKNYNENYNEKNDNFKHSGDQIPLEEKLVNDIIKPTGISYNPSENQLNEIAKRAKNLNLEVLYEVLLNKIYCFNDISNSSLLKSFTVSFIKFLLSNFRKLYL